MEDREKKCIKRGEMEKQSNTKWSIIIDGFK